VTAAEGDRPLRKRSDRSIFRPSMTYLPVYCDSCARGSLCGPGAHGDEQPLMCSFCEGPVRVIPGPVYGDGDWLAFAEIDAALYAAGLDGGNAHALAERLQSLMDGPESQTAIVRTMIEQLPELDKARPALLNRLPRGLRMLKTLLVGRFRDLPLKSGSHTAPANADTARRKTGGS
jgi:hypothetical protein